MEADSGKCKACQESTKDRDVVAFGQATWHTECFRCAKCQLPLDAAAGSLLLLADGSPICDQCCYKCAACGQTITDEAVVAGEQSYHEQCFQCSQCQRPIVDLVFAKSPTDPRKMVCMQCHSGDSSPEGKSQSGAVPASDELQQARAKLAETQKVLDKLKLVSKTALEEFTNTRETLAAERQLREKNERAVQLLKSELERMRNRQISLTQENLKLSQSSLLDTTATDEARKKREQLHESVTQLEQRKQALEASVNTLVDQRNQIVLQVKQTMKNLGVQNTSNRNSVVLDHDVNQFNMQLEAIRANFQQEIAQLEKERTRAANELDEQKRQLLEHQEQVEQLLKQKQQLAIKIDSLKLAQSQVSTQVASPTSPKIPPRQLAKDEQSKSQDMLNSSPDRKKPPTVLPRKQQSSSQLKGSQGELSPTLNPTSPTQSARMDKQVEAGNKSAALLEAQLRDSDSQAQLSSVVPQAASRVTILKKVKIADPSKRAHNFVGQSFLVPTKCMVCSDKVWQMKSKDYQCKACGQACHAKCIKSTSADCTGSHKLSNAPPPSIFGMDLDTLTSLEGRMVPTVVEKCTLAIEHRGLDNEGIYRKSGLASQVRQLMEEMNASKTFSAELDLSNDTDRWPDINCISAILKQYFRQLPVPLFSYDFYGHFISAVIGGTDDEKMHALAEACAMLPDPNFETLKYLMHHLARVSEHAAVNLMSARNLAVVFGPNLLKSPAELKASQNNTVDAAAELGDMAHKNQIVEIMINNCQQLFVAADWKRSNPTREMSEFYQGVRNSQVDETTEYRMKKAELQQRNSQLRSQGSALQSMVKSSSQSQLAEQMASPTMPSDLYHSNYLLVAEDNVSSRPKSAMSDAESESQRTPAATMDRHQQVATSMSSLKTDDEKYQEFAHSFLTRLKSTHKPNAPLAPRTDTADGTVPPLPTSQAK